MRPLRLSSAAVKSSFEGCSPGGMAASIPHTADLLRAARESSTQGCRSWWELGHTRQVWQDGGGYLGVPASSNKRGQTDLGAEGVTGSAPYLLLALPLLFLPHLISLYS